MTTMAETVAAIRRQLVDTPTVLRLDAAMSDTTDETTTLDAGQVGKLREGMVLEHDDGSGELRYVWSTDDDTESFEAVRGYADSTAATHVDGSYLIVEPRFRYDLIAQTVTHVIETALPNADVYTLVPEAITQSVDSTVYDAASSECEEHLSIYQFPSGDFEPTWLRASEFADYPDATSTAHYSTGKSFRITGAYGEPGVDLYYIQCRHKLTLATLNTEEDLMVQYLAIAMLMESKNPQHTSGRTTMGNRTAKAAEFLQSAGWYRQQAELLMKAARSRIKQQVTQRRNFIRTK